MFMQAAVTAYSGFIFDLNANSSLEDFMKACTVIGLAIDLNWVIILILRHSSMRE